MLNVLPTELKLIITNQLDGLSYFCLRTALCQTHGQLPQKLYTQLIQQNYSQLAWFLENKLINVEMFAHFVVRQNNLEVLRWMHTYNYLKKSALLTQEAAAQGHLEILKWLHQENFSLSLEVFKAAIRRGQYQVFAWLLRETQVPRKVLYAYAINYGEFGIANQLMT